MDILLGVLMKRSFFNHLETRKDQISMYSREETISTQTQTNLIFTAASVYEPSALVTGFGSRKQNATLYSTLSTPMSETSSREAATPSFFKRDLSSLLYISGTTSYWSEPDTLIRKTSSRISGLNRSSASVESSSSDSFQSNTGSTWFSGDRTAKSAAPLIEKVIYITQVSPLMSTQNAYVQSTTTTLNSVGSLIISSPYSRSKYTWPSSGTVVRKWTEKSYSKSLLRDNVHETTKQSGQNQFGLTVVSTSKPRFTSRNSVKSVKLETGTMAIITDTIDISRYPTTKSTGISLSAKHSDSTHVVNTFSKCLTKSNITLDRVLTTSRPTAISNMVKNTTDKTITLKWTTQMPEIASPPNHISAYSIQVSLSSKASSKTSIFGSSTSSDKENDTRSSTLATPLLSSLRFSVSEFVSQPSRTLSHGFTSAVMTVSPLLLSTLTQETWTVEEIQTTNCTITSSVSVLPTSYSTASNTVTTTRRKDPSTAVLVEYKSMESSDVFAANSVATQSKMNSVTVQTLLPYITHGGLSTANDLTSHITSQEPSWSLPSIHLSLTIAKVLSSASAISLNTISVSEPQTNAITLKQIETHTKSWISSPKEFITLPISSVSPDNSFENRDTVSSEAAGLSNDSSYILQFTFQTDLRYKLTIDSQSTSTLMTSFSTDALASTSRLDGAVFPVFTSSVHHLKTKEYVKESRLQYKTVSFSATDPHTAFPYSLHKSTGDTLAHSEVSKVTTVVPSSTMFLSRSAVQISSTIRTSSSQMISFGLAIVTSSIQHLESDKSIQERLSRYKTLSFSTTTFQSISRSSLSLTKSTNTRRIPITTASPAVRYTALSQELLSSASGSSVRVSTDISFTSGKSIGVTSSNISLHGSLTTHFPYLKANSNQSGILAPNYTSILQVIPSEDAISHHYRSLITTFMPTMYPTSNVTVSFKIMDGSLIIRNKNYHRNLSNPNTTMFKALADEVEAIIKDIMSFNNTDVLDVEVISFRNGSVIADFYLRVRYDTPLSDQQYAQLLSEANETVWRGLYVTNITVTLRAKVKASPEPSRGEDDADLSKTAIIATLTVFAVLLIAVGSIGVYVCKKKGMCDGSKVKPAQ